MSDVAFGRSRPRTPTFIKLMTMVNLAFALVMLLGWRYLAPYVEEPVLRILGSDVPQDSSIWAYPFVMLWCLPLSAVAGVVIARSFESEKLAKILSLYPVILTVCSCAWLYLLADQYG